MWQLTAVPKPSSTWCPPCAGWCYPPPPPPRPSLAGSPAWWALATLPKWSEGMYFWLVTILFGEGSLCCCCSKWFRPPCSAAGSPLAVVGVKWIFMCPPTAPPQSYQICHRTSLRAIRHDTEQRRRSATHGGEAHACTNGDRSDTWRKDKYKIQKYRITINRFSSDTNDHDLVFLNLTPCYMFTSSLKSQMTQLRVWLALEARITTIRILDCSQTEPLLDI